jgi:hypothetical protein
VGLESSLASKSSSNFRLVFISFIDDQELT